MKSTTFEGSLQVQFIWPCYENVNLGRATFVEIGSASGLRAGVRVESLLLCVREDGSVLRNLKWCLSSPFRTEKKEKKREVLGGTQVEERKMVKKEKGQRKRQKGKET